MTKSNDNPSELLQFALRDVTPEIIKKERERMKKEGKLIEHETPFGTVTILKHKGLKDDEIRFR